MDEAFDLASVRRTLRHMVDKGLVPSIETFDTPSSGFVHNTGCDRRTFPGGYTGVPFRNLLRDHHPEAVQAGPSPRDFTPASDSQPDVRPTPAPVQLAGEEDSDVSNCDLFL